MEYKGVENYHKDWDMTNMFLTGDLYRVLDLDATINSHPIIIPVESPDQITEIFDAISYSKGASVLRMLENFMGDEQFRVGIHNFLNKFKYSNAVTNDLWTELTAVSKDNLNITRIMDTWTRQMGYPVVNVQKVKNGRYKLTQKRYLLDPSLADKSEKSPYGYKWDIPITWVTDLNPNDRQLKWFRSDEGFIEVQVPQNVKWIKFNVGQHGFYRMQYSKQAWLDFSNLLKNDHQVLQTTDRASLINDAFALAESGALPYSIPMAMIQYLRKEKHFVAWETAMRALGQMESLLMNTEAYPLYRNYMLSLVEDHYNTLG